MLTTMPVTSNEDVELQQSSRTTVAERGSLVESQLLVRAPEAARTLSISERKLWELTNCHEIPAVRIGRAVRYDLQDLQAWVERRKGVRP